MLTLKNLLVLILISILAVSVPVAADKLEDEKAAYEAEAEAAKLILHDLREKFGQ